MTSAVAPLPPGSKSRYDLLIRRLSPTWRTWVTQNASRLKASRRPITEMQLKASLKATLPLLGNMEGADIEALAFLVLMESTQSAQDDLRSIMADTKSEIDRKRQLALRGVAEQPATISSLMKKTSDSAFLLLHKAR